MEALENLVRISKLSHEPPNNHEFDGMVAAATTRLQDVNLVGLSTDSQFSLAYGAAHSLALAAFWRGMLMCMLNRPRSIRQYIVL